MLDEMTSGESVHVHACVGVDLKALMLTKDCAGVFLNSLINTLMTQRNVINTQKDISIRKRIIL